MLPTRKMILDRIREFKKIGRLQFFNRYKIRRGAVSHYVLYEKELLDAKVLWAAAHKPPITTSSFNTKIAITELTKLKFNCVDENDAEMFVEGRRATAERKFFSRNPGLVKKAREKRGLVCEVCSFDFNKRYGDIGKGFIECHHIAPLSLSKTNGRVVTVDDVRVLCANCHRMVHYKISPPRSVEHLRKRMQNLD